MCGRTRRVRASQALSNPEAAVAEPYRSFLDALRQDRQSENTVKSAALAFGHLDAFLRAQGKDLRDVTTDDLDRFRQGLLDRGLAVMTAHLFGRHVRRLFRWLAQTGRLFLDPAAQWSLPRPPRVLVVAPTEKQVAALLAQPDVTQPRGLRDRALIETAYSTAARLQELTRLTIFDPDLDRGLLRVMGKGRKERMLPLGKQAVRWLRQYLRDGRPRLAKGRPGEQRLWLRAGGQPISGEGIRMLLRQCATAAGLPPIPPHALRRACATHMLRRGAHPVQIQMLLGHADLSSLGQYLRLTIRDIRAMHAHSKVGR
jgi:integrase/recombinase XerD